MKQHKKIQDVPQPQRKMDMSKQTSLVSEFGFMSSIRLTGSGRWWSCVPFRGGRKTADSIRLSQVLQVVKSFCHFLELWSSVETSPLEIDLDESCCIRIGGGGLLVPLWFLESRPQIRLTSHPFAWRQPTQAAIFFLIPAVVTKQLKLMGGYLLRTLACPPLPGISGMGKALPTTLSHESPHLSPEVVFRVRWMAVLIGKKNLLDKTSLMYWMLRTLPQRYIFFTYNRCHSRWKRSLKTRISDGKTCSEDLGKFCPFYVAFCVERYVAVMNGLLENTAEESWGDSGIWLKHHDTSLCGTSGKSVREILPKRPMIVIVNYENYSRYSP